MKNIKYFRYFNTKYFNMFLEACDYKLEDVIGFSFYGQKQYNNNISKWYNIYFKDGEEVYFKEVIFKDFNEYHQSRLGFRGDKLLGWFDDANVRLYKEKNW